MLALIQSDQYPYKERRTGQRHTWGEDYVKTKRKRPSASQGKKQSGKRKETTRGYLDPGLES